MLIASLGVLVASLGALIADMGRGAGRLVLGDLT